MTDDVDLTHYLASKKKVNDLLALKNITLNDLEDFNQMERDCLSATATNMLNDLKGIEKDNFINKIEPIVPAHIKNQFWENNHLLITKAITKLTRDYGFMPSKNAIAQETGLSRQTVAKHLKDFKTNPDYVAEMEKFKFMVPGVLSNIFNLATKGDVKAARLFFEMVGEIGNRRFNTVVNEQNSYIQINNTILNQENLKRLSTEQLNQIEYIITSTTEKNA